MIAAVTLLSCMALAQAAPVANHLLSREVGKFVRQLDADTAEARQEAEAGLIKLGPGVLKLLPPDGTATAQVKAALARIRGTLQKAAAEAATKGTRVTLQIADKPLAEILALLTKQTGNGFTDLRENLGQEKVELKGSLDVRDAPFWEAVDKLFDTAGLAAHHYGVGDETGGPRVGFIARGPRDLPRFGRASYAGAFRIEGTRLDASRDLRTKEGQILRLGLETTWEPQLHPIAIDLPLSSVRAVDERGEAIEVSGREGTAQTEPQINVRAVELDIPFESPSRDAKRIASLKGKMNVLVPGEVQTFRFALPAKNAAKKAVYPIEQRVGDVVVSLLAVEKNVDVQQIAIKLQFDDAKNALQSHRNWVANNEAFLEGANGKPVEIKGFDDKPVLHLGFDKIHEGENAVGFAYNFPQDLDLSGLTFVYRSPSTIVELPIEFELKGLELP